MRIGEAINSLKLGNPVSRSSWSDTEFIYYLSPISRPAVNNVEKVIVEGFKEKKLEFKEMILKCSDWKIELYEPSQSDLLADDWINVRLE